jgi:GTPase involved in cell partitioning and DNA repair
VLTPAGWDPLVAGLVEGAHANRGLGHRFLRHVERTRALAFVVDAAGGSPLGATPLGPWQQLALLRDEVGRFSPALLRRPWMVVANKTDLLPRPAAALARLQQRCEGAGWGARVVGASATGRGEGGAPQGVPQLLAEMRVLLAAAAAAGGAEAP